MALTQHLVDVTLWIKAESREDAVRFAERRLQIRLNEWVIEDVDQAPFLAGSLLYYNFMPIKRKEPDNAQVTG